MNLPGIGSAPSGSESPRYEHQVYWDRGRLARNEPRSANKVGCIKHGSHLMCQPSATRSTPVLFDGVAAVTYRTSTVSGSRIRYDEGARQGEAVRAARSLRARRPRSQ